MKNRIKIVALTLLLAVTVVAVYPSTGKMVHADDSNFIVIGDQDTPTNKDIILDLVASDALSGVKEVHLPDGRVITEGTSEYTITENGTYTFKVVDMAGNETVGDLIVKNIFKALPTLNLTADVTTPTNQDVTITALATAVGEGNGIASIVKPENAVEVGAGVYTVSENGTYTFKTIDLAGNEKEETIEIGNINKVLPIITVSEYSTEWTNQDITVTATVDKGTLNAESHTFTENGTFKFEVTDEYGNKAEQTVTISNIDKVDPNATITIGE